MNKISISQAEAQTIYKQVKEICVKCVGGYGRGFEYILPDNSRVYFDSTGYYVYIGTSYTPRQWQSVYIGGICNSTGKHSC